MCVPSICGLSVDVTRLRNLITVTASAKRLYRNIGVKELVPWIWSRTNHHGISSLCPPKDSRSRGGGTVSRDALWPDTSL